MATKPSISILVRASQTLYTTGPAPLVGTATKIDPDIALPGQTVEGWKVDSPLGTTPVFAQWKNYFDNLTDIWLDWLEDGSFTGAGDAHVVETNSLGATTLQRLTILGQFGSPALDVSTDSGPAIIAAGSPTGTAVAITAGNSQVGLSVSSGILATATSVLVVHTDTSAAGITVSASGPEAITATHDLATGDCYKGVSTGVTSTVYRGTAVDGPVFQGNNSGDGVVLQMDPVTVTPTVFPDDAGGVWSFDTTADESDYIGVRLNGLNAYVQTANQKLSYAYDENLSGTISVGSQDVAAQSDTLASPDGANDDVLIEISGQFQGSGGSGSVFGQIIVADDAGGGPIRTLILILDPNDILAFRTFYWRIPYQLSAAGVFSIRLTLSASGGYTLDWFDWTLSVKSNPK